MPCPQVLAGQSALGAACRWGSRAIGKGSGAGPSQARYHFFSDGCHWAHWALLAAVRPTRVYRQEWSWTGLLLPGRRQTHRLLPVSVTLSRPHLTNRSSRLS